MTLRTRMTVLATAVTGLTLLAAGVAVFLDLQGQLVRGIDEAAQARLAGIVADARAGRLVSVLTDVGDNDIAQVVDDRGNVLAASPSILGRPPLDLRPASGSPSVRTMTGPDDSETERYRMWVQSTATTGSRVRVYVGTSLESVRQATSALRRSLELGLPIVTLLLGLAIWLVLGRALRRVEVIRSEVADISDAALHRRVQESEVPDEVGRLASTMNQMLDRLEEASLRQKAFVADASHELQTPLAGLRTELEVALARAEPVGEDRLKSLLSTCDQMERLVRDLLFLAVQDAGPRPSPRPVDLDDVVLEEAARARAHSRARIDAAAVSAGPVVGDRDELQRLVRNLLDNAVRHARSRVSLSVRTADGCVRLEVADDGAGIPVEERERIFDRFHCLDGARSPAGGGTGLGLAIARSIATRHGGSLTLAPPCAGVGAVLVLLLPAVP